jgi:hypothetical protein
MVAHRAFQPRASQSAGCCRSRGVLEWPANESSGDGETEVKNAKIWEAKRSDAAHALAHVNDTRGLGVELASSGVHSYIVLSVEFNSVAARRAFLMPLGATVLAEFAA